MHKGAVIVRSKNRGVTLIEVLVTFIVLSVGLLGLAVLHGSGLKNNQSAYWRSQATILAYSIFDSMRGNRDAARNADYDIALTSVPPAGATVANTDVANWINLLQVKLPGQTGQGGIDCTTNAPVCVVTVQWDDSAGEGGRVAQQFLVMSQL